MSTLRDGWGDLARLLRGHDRDRRTIELQDLATKGLRDPATQPGWVLRAFNLTLQARGAAQQLVGHSARNWVSRARFQLRRGPAAPLHTLSILCPTRERVGRLDNFVRSVYTTSEHPERIELLCYGDADDPALPDYEAFFEAARRRFPRLLRCAMHVGEPIPVPRTWNVIAALCEGDFLLMGNDDQIYVDYGWDVRLDQTAAAAAAAHPDAVYCLYFDAGQYPEGAADFPIVSRAWYEELGYFTPAMFEYWETETWTFDIARRLDRLFAVDALVDHMHYQDYKAPFDATYQRHRLTREKSYRDHARYIGSGAARKQEARRLQAAITRRGVDVPGKGASATGGTAPGERARPILDPARLWFVRHLEDGYPRIREEVERAGNPLALGSAADTDDRGGPSAVHELVLWRGGRRCDATCSLFPVTAELIAAIPEATTLSPGIVALAWLPAGTHLASADGGPSSHTRVYLSVKVDGECRLSIDGETAYPEEGQCLAVDASLDREFFHDGAEEQVFLILDVLDSSAASLPAGSPR
jgi:hypothetical protein